MCFDVMFTLIVFINFRYCTVVQRIVLGVVAPYTVEKDLEGKCKSRKLSNVNITWLARHLGSCGDILRTFGYWSARQTDRRALLLELSGDRRLLTYLTLILLLVNTLHLSLFFSFFPSFPFFSYFYLFTFLFSFL